MGSVFPSAISSASINATLLNAPVLRSRAAAVSRSSGRKVRPTGTPAIRRIAAVRTNLLPLIVTSPNVSFGPGSKVTDASSFWTSCRAVICCPVAAAFACPSSRQASTAAVTALRITCDLAVLPVANASGICVAEATGVTCAVPNVKRGPIAMSIVIASIDRKASITVSDAPSAVSVTVCAVAVEHNRALKMLKNAWRVVTAVSF